MARGLRVYYGNYDGRRAGLVAAYSQKEAAQIIGTSATDFRNYWGETGNMAHVAIALGSPQTLFLRPFSKNGQWEAKPRD